MEAAERFTEGFRTGAQNAVLLMCSVVSYDYMPVLDGLIRDMMHATSSRKSIRDA